MSISFLKYFSENLKIPKNSIKGFSKKFQKIFRHIFQKFQKFLGVQRLNNPQKKEVADYSATSSFSVPMKYALRLPTFGIFTSVT